MTEEALLEAMMDQTERFNVAIDAQLNAGLFYFPGGFDPGKTWFTNAQDGRPSLAPPAAGSVVIVESVGRVLQMVGDGSGAAPSLYQRGYMPIVSGRSYRSTVRMRQTVDDGAVGSAVYHGFSAYDADFNYLGDVGFSEADADLAVADGWQVFTATTDYTAILSAESDAVYIRSRLRPNCDSSGNEGDGTAQIALFRLEDYSDPAAAASDIAFAATDRILGRTSSGAGAGEEVVFTDQAQQLCDDTSFAAMLATLGAPGLALNNVYTGNQTIAGGTPTFNYERSANDADEKRWSWRLTGTGSLEVVARTDASPDSGGNIAISFARDGATLAGVSIGSGVTIGSPTGGNKGAGTLNAAGSIYVNNSALTCGPLEWARTGSLDLEKWDGFMPDRVTEAQVEYVVEEREREIVETFEGQDEAGKSVRLTRRRTVTELVETGERREITPARTEPRRHEAMHRFAAMLDEGFDPRDPDNYCARLAADSAVPGLFTEQEWADLESRGEARDLGHTMTRTHLALDCMAIAFAAAVDRIKSMDVAFSAAIERIKALEERTL